MCFIQHFFHLKEDEVLALPISKYNTYLEQCFNLASIYRQGAVDLETKEDKELRLKEERNQFKLWKLANEGN